MDLALDKRTEKLLKEHIPEEGIRGPSPAEKLSEETELAYPAEVSLMSIIFDSGYKPIEEDLDLYIRSNEDKSVEFFAMHDTIEQAPGFAYIRFEKIDEGFRFKELYEERIKKRIPVQLYVAFGCIAGLVSFFSGSSIAFYQVMNKPADTKYWGMAAVIGLVGAAMCALIGLGVGKDTHAQSKEFLSNYQALITTGRDAIIQATGYKRKPVDSKIV
jgi:hypothetical protein